MNKEIKETTEKIKKIWKSNKYDPNGSYTGNSNDKSKPLQDQDDL